MGSGTLKLTVNDKQAHFSIDNSIVVTVTSAIPIADAGPDEACARGTVCTLTAGSASDADADLASYEWAWNPGSPCYNTSFVEIPCPALTGATGTITGSAATVPGPSFSAPPDWQQGFITLIVTDTAAHASTADFRKITGQ